MRLTQHSRSLLAARRFRARMKLSGYEEVSGASSGNLWELHRGSRQNHRIVAAVIAPDGQSVWLKIEPPAKAEAAE